MQSSFSIIDGIQYKLHCFSRNNMSVGFAVFHIIQLLNKLIVLDVISQVSSAVFDRYSEDVKFKCSLEVVFACFDENLMHIRGNGNNLVNLT